MASRDTIAAMTGSAAIEARFWGVRGSIASPGPHTVRYGGNTPCIEVHAGGRLIILDGGTGMRGLGQQVLARKRPVEADIFFSHLHWDHIQGFPFFTPAYVPGNKFRIYGLKKPDRTVKSVLEGQMTDPSFPVPLSVMGSTLEFHDLQAGDVVELGPVTVRTAPMTHPGGCLGVRIEHAGKALVYCTDTEHDSETGEMDPNVLALAQDADCFIYDTMYTVEEYENGKVGWGHSTFTEGIRLSRAANVRQLQFFHHEPNHSDDFLDECLSWARRECAGEDLVLEMATEGEWVIL